MEVLTSAKMKGTRRICHEINESSGEILYEKVLWDVQYLLGGIISVKIGADQPASAWASTLGELPCYYPKQKNCCAKPLEHLQWTLFTSDKHR